MKISYFLKSILPKSERIKRVLFSGYGKFPKSGSKFQSVTINVFYVYIYNICHYYYDLNEARGQNQCARMSTQPCCDVPLPMFGVPDLGVEVYDTEESNATSSGLR